MASGPWSDDEIGVTVDVYFLMLTPELAGENYTKSEFRREVERDVDRSSGADIRIRASFLPESSSTSSTTSRRCLTSWAPYGSGYYQLPGPLTQHARLRPDTYRGLPSVGS